MLYKRLKIKISNVVFYTIISIKKALKNKVKLTGWLGGIQWLGFFRIKIWL